MSEYIKIFSDCKTMDDIGTMFFNWTATPPRIGVVKTRENNIEILPPLTAGQNSKYSRINVR